MFKKILSFIVVVVMTMTFVACGENSNGDNEDTEEKVKSSTKGLEFELNEDEKSYTVTGIGDCKSTEIEIGKYKKLPVTNIDDKAFYKCDNLTSVTLSNSVISIGESAFEGCTGLTSIKIPSSVESIESYAFAGCTGIAELTILSVVAEIRKMWQHIITIMIRMLHVMFAVIPEVCMYVTIRR